MGSVCTIGREVEGRPIPYPDAQPTSAVTRGVNQDVKQQVEKTKHGPTNTVSILSDQPRSRRARTLKGKNQDDSDNDGLTTTFLEEPISSKGINTTELKKDEARDEERQPLTALSEDSIDKSKTSSDASDGETVDGHSLVQSSSSEIKTDGSVGPHKCSSTDVNMSSSWTDIEAKYRDVSSKCARYHDVESSSTPELVRDQIDAIQFYAHVKADSLNSTRQDKQYVTPSEPPNMSRDTDSESTPDLPDNSDVPESHESNENVTSALARGIMLNAIESACFEMTMSENAATHDQMQREQNDNDAPDEQNVKLVNSNEETKLTVTNSSFAVTAKVGELESKDALTSESDEPDAKSWCLTSTPDERLDETKEKKTDLLEPHVDKDEKPGNDSNPKDPLDERKPLITVGKSTDLQEDKVISVASTSSSSSDIVEKARHQSYPINEKKVADDHVMKNNDAEDNTSQGFVVTNTLDGESLDENRDSKNSAHGSENGKQDSNNDCTINRTREVVRSAGKRGVLDKGDNVKTFKNRAKFKPIAGSAVQENNSNNAESVPTKAVSENTNKPSGRILDKLMSRSPGRCAKKDAAEQRPVKRTTKSLNLTARLQRSSGSGKPNQSDQAVASSKPYKGKHDQRAPRSANERRGSKQAMIQASMSPLSKSIAYFPLEDNKTLSEKHHAQWEGKEITLKQSDIQGDTKQNVQGAKSVSSAEMQLIDHKRGRFSKAAVPMFPNGNRKQNCKK